MKNTQKYERQFKQYAAVPQSYALARKQADALAYNEMGQNWQYMLTLRVPQNEKDRILLQTLEDFFNIAEAELQLARKRRRERIKRSVYIHSCVNDYHAHVYVKTPRGMQEWQDAAWLDSLLACWYKTSALSGHCATKDERRFLFHVQPRTSNTLAWGAYGIKSNTGHTAWIDDLTRLHIPQQKAYQKGRLLAGLTAK